MHTFVRLAPATDYSKAETWGVKRDACHWAHLEGLLPKGRVVQEVGHAVHRPAEPEPKRPGRDVIKEANCGRTARSVWSARSLLPLSHLTIAFEPLEIIRRMTKKFSEMNFFTASDWLPLPRLRVQDAAKIITGQFIIRVNPQCGSEMGFRLLQIPLP